MREAEIHSAIIFFNHRQFYKSLGYPNLKDTDVIISGYNLDIDSGTVETIWPNGGIYAWPTQARTIGLVSDSANDDAAGTGARVVRVEGLDANGDLYEEDIDMDGTTAVSKSQPLLAVNKLTVIETGTGRANAGTITATAATDNTVSATIPVGKNQSLQCVMMVPNDRDFLLRSYYGNLRDVNASINVELKINIGDGIFRTVHTVTARLGGSSFVEKIFSDGMKIPAGSQIRLDAGVTADNVATSGGFEGDWVS